MFLRREFFQPKLILLFAVVCALCLSTVAQAERRGKKGKPAAEAKQTAKAKSAVHKPEPKNNARGKKETADKKLPARQTERLAKRNDKREVVSGKGKKSRPETASDKLALTKSKTNSRDKAEADKKLKSAEAKRTKDRAEQKEKSAAARHEAEKSDRNKRAAVREEKGAAKEERATKEEKAVQEKRSAARETQQAVAEAQSTRKGKFGRTTERAVAEETTVERQNVVKTSETIIPIATSRAVVEPVSNAVVPDVIEVKEYDPANIGVDYTGRRPLRAFSSAGQTFNVSSRRIEVRIDPERITEIQEALRTKGFYSGEPTGVWDDATWEAMQRFQISQRIDATGYPTAHSLKRLGLTSW
jgi:hypothetical protein